MDDIEQYDPDSEAIREILRANDEEPDFPGRSYSFALKNKYQARAEELEREIGGHVNSMQTAWEETRRHKKRFRIFAAAMILEHGIIIVFLLTKLLEK